jgi:hypothetical protein
VRLHVRGSLQPDDAPICERIKPTIPFRFMDLPVELRLHIAEYSLKTDVVLCWEWPEYKKTPNSSTFVGKFAEPDHLRALCQVSCQLHRELASVVWKVNDFEFIKGVLGDWFGCLSFSEVEKCMHLQEAHQFFAVQASTQTLQALRSVIVGLNYYGTTTERHELLNIMNAMAQVMPHVRHQFQSWWSWSLRFNEFNYEVGSQMFVEYGRSIISDLTSAGFKSERNWKIHPNLCEEDHEWLERRMDDRNAILALQWLQNGI